MAGETAVRHDRARRTSTVRAALLAKGAHECVPYTDEVAEDVFRSCVASLAPELLHRKLVIDFAVGRWEIVLRGNRHRLCEAVTQLLLDAMARTSPGNRIVIATARDDDRDAFVITPGLGPALKTPLPEGIGLAVASAILRAHGGTLEVDGSTVTVWFKRTSPARSMP